jgi:hypothetical protein
VSERVLPSLWRSKRTCNARALLVVQTRHIPLLQAHKSSSRKDDLSDQAENGDQEDPEQLEILERRHVEANQAQKEERRAPHIVMKLAGFEEAECRMRDCRGAESTRLDIRMASKKQSGQKLVALLSSRVWDRLRFCSFGSSF